MGNQRDSSTDDDALVWKRLADSVTPYEPASSPVRAKPSPSPRRGKQPTPPSPRPATKAKAAAATTTKNIQTATQAQKASQAIVDKLTPTVPMLADALAKANAAAKAIATDKELVALAANVPFSGGAISSLHISLTYRCADS